MDVLIPMYKPFPLWFAAKDFSSLSDHDMCYKLCRFFKAEKEGNKSGLLLLPKSSNFTPAHK